MEESDNSRRSCTKRVVARVVVSELNFLYGVNRYQLMYKRKRHPEVEASQMPYSYQVAGPGIEPGTS